MHRSIAQPECISLLNTMVNTAGFSVYTAAFHTRTHTQTDVSAKADIDFIAVKRDIVNIQVSAESS